MQQTEAWPRMTSSTSAWSDRGFQTNLWAKNYPGGDRDTLGSKRHLDLVLVLGEHLVDVLVVVKVDCDSLVGLFYLHTQKCLHAAASSDVNILGVLPQKLVLDLSTGCCVHHVVHKQAVTNKMLIFALHEDRLLAVDCGVAVLCHPV